MKRLSLILVIVPALALGAACADREMEPPAGESAEPAEVAQIAPENRPGSDDGAELSRVEVAAEGTQFEPPIDPERLPEGVWYCDMGTTHYARAEKGDGKCAVCGMFLVEKEAETGTEEG